MSWGKSAGVIGVCLLAGLLLNLWLTHRDDRRRQELETVDQPSAVGDQRFFPKPKDIRIGEVITTMSGRPLRAADDEAIDLSDGIMRRAGAEDSEGFVLYRADEDESDKHELQGHLFLKVGRNDYLRLRPEDD